MKWWKMLLVCFIAALFIATGCQIASDLWPTKIPRDALLYTGHDVENIDVGWWWQTLSKLKEVKEQVLSTHIAQQLKLSYELKKDKALYSRALEQVNLNIETAEAERESMIGTIEKPGWLTSVLLGASGIGVYFAGYRKQRPEDYSEAELETEVAKRVEAEIAKRQTKSAT